MIPEVANTGADAGPTTSAAALVAVPVLFEAGLPRISTLDERAPPHIGTCVEAASMTKVNSNDRRALDRRKSYMDGAFQELGLDVKERIGAGGYGDPRARVEVA